MHVSLSLDPGSYLLTLLLFWCQHLATRGGRHRGVTSPKRLGRRKLQGARALLLGVAEDGTDFDRWLALLDEREVESEIRSLEVQARELEAKIAARRTALDLKRGATSGASSRTAHRETESRVSERHEPQATNNQRHPGLTDMVRRLIASEPERTWKPGDIRDSLLSGQAINGSKQELDQRIRTVLTKMYRRGELERPRTGAYRLSGGG